MEQLLHMENFSERNQEPCRTSRLSWRWRTRDQNHPRAIPFALKASWSEVTHSTHYAYHEGRLRGDYNVTVNPLLAVDQATTQAPVLTCLLMDGCSLNWISLRRIKRCSQMKNQGGMSPSTLTLDCTSIQGFPLPSPQTLPCSTLSLGLPRVICYIRWHSGPGTSVGQARWDAGVAQDPHIESEEKQVLRSWRSRWNT